MSELKACPFCGKQPTVGLNGYPRCPIPGIGTHAGGMTVDEWNTRPLEDALQKRVEECAEILRTFRRASNDAIDELTCERDNLRTSISKAVKEIEDSMQSADWEVASVYDGALLILKNNGLIGEQK